MAKRRQQYTINQYVKDKRLVETVEEFEIDTDNAFQDLEDKYEILRSYGYRSLRGTNSLEQVEDAQLGVSFRNIYKTLLF